MSQNTLSSQDYRVQSPWDSWYLEIRYFVTLNCFLLSISDIIADQTEYIIAHSAAITPNAGDIVF